MLFRSSAAVESAAGAEQNTCTPPRQPIVTGRGNSKRQNLPILPFSCILSRTAITDCRNAPPAIRSCDIDSAATPDSHELNDRPTVSAQQFILAGLLFATALGCGTTQQRTGTEQLLLSDAVDRSIDQFDLTALSGKTVYLDSTYITPDKSPPTGGKSNYVNSNYIISTLRQKLITSGCLLRPSADAADYIIEARVGALGTDALEVTYGIPASNALSTAATLLSSVPAAPTIPEISIGKRNAALSTSKVVLFAYHRETGTPVWQSGAAVARSDAKDSWLFGAGPIQRGTIYGGTQFAGTRLRFPWSKRETETKPVPELKIADSHQFVQPEVLEHQLAIREEEAARAKESEGTDVVPVGHEEDAE